MKNEFLVRVEAQNTAHANILTALVLMDNEAVKRVTGARLLVHLLQGGENIEQNRAKNNCSVLISNQGNLDF